MLEVISQYFSDWVWLFEQFPLFLASVVALLAALIASFFGVVAQRLPGMLGWEIPEEVASDVKANRHLPSTLGGRSKCDHCLRTIPAWSLIPVFGWLLSRGKCGSCAKPISPVYPCVEAVTSLVSGTVAYLLGPTPELIAILFLFWTGVLLAWIDIREYMLPDIIVIPIAVIGLLFSPFEQDAIMRFIGGAIGVGVPLLIMMLISLQKKVNAVAFGDVFLFGAYGTWVGPGSLVLGMFLCSLFCIVHCLVERGKGKDWVPMGPSICASFVIIAFLSTDTAQPLRDQVPFSFQYPELHCVVCKSPSYDSVEHLE
ncbi:prepilin peptidase [Thalassospira xianhensis]|uniref:prepilin peptidase n=1 Tax=Thalassospira xianhensis TaxID=478503 RepID=UPI000DED87F8|nr:A24 family peptidase [Thalassospira xianhensis]